MEPAKARTTQNNVVTIKPSEMLSVRSSCLDMNHINPPKRDKDKKEYIKISPPSS